MRSYRISQAIIAASVGIILTCHIWLALFHSDYSKNRKDSDRDQIKSNPEEKAVWKVPISQWRKGYLEAIDFRRIVLHETAGRGHLTARQSCAVESAARHNPDRPIHLFMRWTPLNDNGNSSSAAWLNVLGNYKNVQIVQINDDILYSENTVLFTRFKTPKWRKNIERSGNLADYIRCVTLFKGGGLFIDIDSVITIKPLTWSKWNNFFVVKRNKENNPKSAGVSVKMLHLLHGHHLIDEIILNVAKADVKESTLGNSILAAAIDDSVNQICGGKKNQCLDVRLIDEEDVFLPPFNMSIYSNKESTVNKQGAVLTDWNSMSILKRNLFYPVLSALLEQHCPFTFTNAKHFQN